MYGNEESRFTYRRPAMYSWLMVIRECPISLTSPHELIGDSIDAVRPSSLPSGSILVGFNRSPESYSKSVELFVQLTDRYRYLIRHSTRDSWAKQLKHEMRFWLAMTPAQRLMNGCRLQLQVLKKMVRQLPAHGLESRTLRDILDQGEGHASLTEGSVLGLFDTWLDQMETVTGADPVEICRLLGQAVRKSAGVASLIGDENQERLAQDFQLPDPSQQVRRHRSLLLG